MNVELFLRRHPLFGSLPASLLAELATQSRTRTFAAGELICREGSSADSVYVLLSGRIEVERDGRGAVASLGRRGELMGEMSILTGTPRSATLRAELESGVLEIPSTAFQQMLDRAPNLGVRLAQVLSERLSASVSPPRALRKLCYIGFLVTGPQRLGALRALGQAVATRSKKPILLYDLVGDTNGPELMATLSNVPIQGQEDFVRGLAKRNPSGVTELPGAIRDDHWGFFLSVLRESFDRVLFGIPVPFFRTSHKTVCEACDLLVVVCGPEMPGVAELQKLRELRKPMILARVLGRSRVEWAGTAGFADLVLPAREESVATPEAMAPLARKLLGQSIGLALGSGAARGYAHIGVVDTLLRENIPIDYITGTSMGSVIAALHASGKTTAEIVRYAEESSRPHGIWSLLDLAFPRSGFLRGGRVEKQFRKMFGDVTIENLPLPFRAVATDVAAGEEVVLDRGPVWKAVRASSSLPCFFEPVKQGERHLVDGGVTNPIPVSHLLELGADRTIAVNVTAGVPQDRRAPGILTIMMNSIYTLQTLVSDARSSLADVTIVPEFGNLNWTDFARAGEMIEVGRVATRKAMPEIRRLLETP